MYEYTDQPDGTTKVVRLEAADPGVIYAVPVATDGVIRTPAEAPEVLLPGVVVTEPGAEPQLIPYEKADRSPAGPLLALHGFAAAHFGISPDLLVSLRGQITDHGSVALFARNAHEGDAEPASYVIASYDDRGRLSITSRSLRRNAETGYSMRLAVLG
jgi:hypothetical protein